MPKSCLEIVEGPSLPIWRLDLMTWGKAFLPANPNFLDPKYPSLPANLGFQALIKCFCQQTLIVRLYKYIFASKSRFLGSTKTALPANPDFQALNNCLCHQTLIIRLYKNIFASKAGYLGSRHWPLPAGFAVHGYFCWNSKKIASISIRRVYTNALREPRKARSAHASTNSARTEFVDL